jgi:hypothetical protein
MKIISIFAEVTLFLIIVSLTYFDYINHLQIKLL